MLMAKGSLACRILAEPGGENAAHEAFGDVGRVDGRALDGGANSDGSEFHGREMRESAEEFSNGRAGCTDDDDFTHGVSDTQLLNVFSGTSTRCRGNIEVYDARSRVRSLCHCRL
jgi:hypothetical protein